MARRLAEIQAKIDVAGAAFYHYLESNLSSEMLKLLSDISQLTDLYIFSGVIRNFFLKNDEVRDVDIVLEKEIDLSNIFADTQLRRNSYGGYKFNVAGTYVDLWYLRETWGLKHQKIIDFNTIHHIVEHVPRTAFFNFSAILYSFKERKFYYSKEFLQFLQNKEVNVVFRPNANYQLCVVNSFYYSDKYNLRLANSLKKYVVELFKANYEDYEDVQRKHFGRVLYSNSVIRERVHRVATSLT